MIRSSEGVVILDEAYAEFMGEGFLGSAPSYENLLVVRTLSKAFGLAGARIGYAAGNAALVSAVEKSRGPYKVSAPAERTALAVMSEDRDWITGRIEEVRANRARFVAALERLGLAPLPSDANFVLFGRFADAPRGWQSFLDRGVLIRDVGIPERLRVTVGVPEENDAFLAAAGEIVDKELW